MQKSILLGALIGIIFGGLIGAGAGAITMTLNGILIGLIVGLLLGGVTGALTAALTVKTAGTTGGIGVGYFTGMVFGALFGIMLGAFTPTSLWTSGLPMLEGLGTSRFETVIHVSFLLSILAAIVGVWVGGKNLVPRNLSVAKQDRIDQYDLVEIVVVPEQYHGIIDVGDIGVAIEIYDHEEFEIECMNPDGSYKWLATLNGRYIRLKSKIPDNMYM